MDAQTDEQIDINRKKKDKCSTYKAQTKAFAHLKPGKYRKLYQKEHQ